jgi:hypothetical protein
MRPFALHGNNSTSGRGLLPQRFNETVMHGRPRSDYALAFHPTDVSRCAGFPLRAARRYSPTWRRKPPAVLHRENCRRPVILAPTTSCAAGDSIGARPAGDFPSVLVCSVAARSRRRGYGLNRCSHSAQTRRIDTAFRSVTGQHPLHACSRRSREWSALRAQRDALVYAAHDGPLG